jgi:molybdate transport system substrate-binding protein
MTDILIFSGGAPKLIFNQLLPEFERKHGHKVTFVFAVTKVLSDRLAAGEKPDVLVLPTNILDGLQKDGVVRAEHRAVLGLVSINAVVKKGAPKPDLSTTEKVKQAMLNSRKLAMAPPGMTPSGTHMGKLLDKLDIADALKPKLIHRPALEGGVELVESGEAELGFYPKSEVIGFAGLSIAGPLPAEIQLTTIYGAAVTTLGGSPDAAAAFIGFMTDPRHRAPWSAGGFDPPA